MKEAIEEKRLDEAAEHLTEFIRAFTEATMGRAQPDAGNKAVRVIFSRLEHLVRVAGDGFANRRTIPRCEDEVMAAWLQEVQRETLPMAKARPANLNDKSTTSSGGRLRVRENKDRLEWLRGRQHFLGLPDDGCFDPGQCSNGCLREDVEGQRCSDAPTQPPVVVLPRQEYYYIVLRVRRWDDIKGTMEPHGVPAALSAEHMPGVGFMPVYDTAEEARADYGDDVPLQAAVRVACDDPSEAVE